jgi:hypothetical protein
VIKIHEQGLLSAKQLEFQQARYQTLFGSGLLNQSHAAFECVECCRRCQLSSALPNTIESLKCSCLCRLCFNKTPRNQRETSGIGNITIQKQFAMMAAT